MTLSNGQAFTNHLNEVRQLADHRDMDLAYDAARQLVADFPDEIRARFTLNYVVCVGNKAGGPQHKSPDVIRQTQRHFAGGMSEEVLLVIGDMKRDRAIGLIRHAIGRADLAAAEVIIDKLRGAYEGSLDEDEIVGEHRSDPNRLAALFDVEGRLLYARGRYIEADRLHGQAHRLWLDPDTNADPVWVYNNRVHWLKSVVAAYGRRAVRAKWLSQDIHQGCPGSRNRGVEATIIRLPFVGNMLHDLAIQYR